MRAVKLLSGYAVDLPSRIARARALRASSLRLVFSDCDSSSRSRRHSASASPEINSLDSTKNVRGAFPNAFILYQKARDRSLCASHELMLLAPENSVVDIEKPPHVDVWRWI